ncbi:hypothetical protein F5B20DRAFT_572145 [Whalleya microplaca]|nr:hypothetical protein F5B20DRAFT_572145 [Whalleya microplaca]
MELFFLQRIPPESPDFINIPNPPQDQSMEAFRDLKPQRGHLPIPRQVFKSRDGHLKTTEDFLARSAPEPAPDRPAPRSDTQAWKRAMAASRRANMRSGVRDLWERKQRRDRFRAETQAAALAANRAAATAPEREDERLTRASVSPGTLQTAVQADPLRFATAEARRARTAALAASRSEARRDAIQELYMKARGFIVEEAELAAEVDRLFAPDYWDRLGKSAIGLPMRNIWDLEGRPTNVNDMLSDVARSSSLLVKDLESEHTRTLKRQKEVAEELTGGKMDQADVRK